MKYQHTLTAAMVSLALFGSCQASAENVRIGGKVFFDYSNKTEAAKPNLIGGNVTRSYLTAQKKRDDTWQAKIIFDAAYDKAATGKKSNVFLKIAQLTGNFSDEPIAKLWVDERQSHIEAIFVME